MVRRSSLRQGLNYAIDKAQVTHTLWGDAAAVAASVPVGPNMWLFAEDTWKAAYATLPAYKQDLAKAKQLLDESEVADQLNGKVILVDENPVRLGQALALQDAARELGYQLEIEKHPYQEMVSRIFSGDHDYDIVVGGWSADFPDPAGNLVPIFHSRNTGAGGANYANYKSPQVDKLLDEQQGLSDKSRRAELLTEAITIIANDSPMIVFDYPRITMALNQAYNGYTPNPLYFWDAYALQIKRVE